MATQPHFYRK
jgi:hypothetical protein